jgi:alpha-L-fucosidase
MSVKKIKIRNKFYLDDDEIDTPIPWYLSGGVSPASLVAVYQPMGDASLAASYVNKINPGVHDLVAGVAPTFNSIKGWTFNGITQYLISDLIADANTTVIISFCEATTPGAGVIRTLLGAYNGATAFSMQNVQSITGRKYDRGGFLSRSGYGYEGVRAIAGNKGYYYGVEETAAISAGALPAVAFFIGAMSNSGAPIQFYNGTICAIAVYSSVLTAGQILSITQNIPCYSKLPTIFTAKQKEFLTLQFGAFICWNMSTFQNLEWATPDVAVDTFAPTDLDIDDWLDACVDAGMKYATLTVKHHDGFCLWPTAFHDPGELPYSIAETLWYINNGSPDVTGLFVAGCVARGLKPCIYFSIWDLTHEVRTGTDETTDAAAYIAMIQAQLTELLSNYGQIFALWFDGWDWQPSAMSSPTEPYIPFLTIYNHVKSLQPNCVVIVNNHYHARHQSEIQTWETTSPGATNIILSEDSKPIRLDNTWFHDNTKDQSAAALKTAVNLHTLLTNDNLYKANFHLDITPDRSGHLPAAQVTILHDIGLL